MGAFCCYGNQTKRQIIIILAILNCPYPSKICIKFLHATSCLVLFYIPTKYHQNIPKCIRVEDMKSISNKIKGNNSKSKTVRVVILVCDMLSCPVLHFYYQCLPFTDTYANGICPKNNMSPIHPSVVGDIIMALKNRNITD